MIMDVLNGDRYYKELYKELYQLSKEIGEELRERKERISIAESCTGGLLCHIITEVPGSSDYFVLGVVSYSNYAKEKVLGVEKETLKRYGAVSGETVMEMAIGVKELGESEWGLAISGIAGPTGGSIEKPIGLVYFSIATPDNQVFVFKEEFGEDKSRSLIKLLTCKATLSSLKEKLIEYKGKEIVKDEDIYSD